MSIDARTTPAALTDEQLIDLGRTDGIWRMDPMVVIDERDRDRGNDIPSFVNRERLYSDGEHSSWQAILEHWIKASGKPRHLSWETTRAGITALLDRAATSPHIERRDDGWYELSVEDPHVLRVRLRMVVRPDGTMDRVRTRAESDEQQRAHEVESRLAMRAARLARARTTESDARSDLADAVRDAHQAGLSIYRIQQLTGLAKVTVEKWIRA